MKLQLADLKTERQWRAATGFDQARFEQLLVLFNASYLSLYGKSVAARQAELAVTPSLQSEAELLYFTLYSLKAGGSTYISLAGVNYAINADSRLLSCVGEINRTSSRTRSAGDRFASLSRNRACARQ